MTAEGRKGRCEALGLEAFDAAADGAADGPARPPAEEAALFAGAPGGEAPVMENWGE